MPDENQPHLVEIAAVLKEVTARITSAATVAEAVDGLLLSAAQILPADVRCEVTMVSEGEPAAYAATGLPAEMLDEDRHAGGDSPGLDAVRTRDIVLSNDICAERRWPNWTARARRNGIRAVLAYPFDVDEVVLGALTLHAQCPESLTGEVPVIAMLLADHASLLLRVRIRQLAEEALLAQVSDGSESGTVERAIGIVMAQRGCAPDQALRHLHDAATNLGVGVSTVAERLVQTVSSRAV